MLPKQPFIRRDGEKNQQKKKKKKPVYDGRDGPKFPVTGILG